VTPAYPRHYLWIIGRLMAEYPYGRAWADLSREAQRHCRVSGQQAAAGLRWLRESGLIDGSPRGSVFLDGRVVVVLEVLDLRGEDICARAVEE
jgi:hypothetical protein